MYKALKFRIYPTKKQEKQIINNFEASRFIYNYYLEKAKTEKTNNFLNDYKKNTPNNNLKKQNQTVIMKTIFHLEDNIKKYGTTLRYKNKYERNAYTINNNSLNKIELDLKERIYKCNKCNNEIDRDLNASINIMTEGYKMYIKSKYKIIKEI